MINTPCVGSIYIGTGCAIVLTGVQHIPLQVEKRIVGHYGRALFDVVVILG